MVQQAFFLYVLYILHSVFSCCAVVCLEELACLGGLFKATNMLRRTLYARLTLLVNIYREDCATREGEKQEKSQKRLHPFPKGIQNPRP